MCIRDSTCSIWLAEGSSTSVFACCSQAKIGSSTFCGTAISYSASSCLLYTSPDSVPAHPEWTAYEKGYVETGEGIIGAWRLDLNEDACDELVVLRQAMGSFPTLRLQVYGFQNGSYSQIYLLYEEEQMCIRDRHYNQP